MNLLTEIIDKIRITFGDSECPLKGRCPDYEVEADTCNSTRGRLEDGNRASCYKHVKALIRQGKIKEGVYIRR